MSMDKLIEKIAEKQNPTVAGLDPKLSYIPEHIRSASYEKYGKTLEGAADALLQFNKGLIDALCDIGRLFVISDENSATTMINSIIVIVSMI